MAENNILALMKIIKTADNDPDNITDAMWAAGYRKPELTPEKAVNFALKIITRFEDANLPRAVRPKSYADILKGELNDDIVEAVSQHNATAASAAKALAIQGYSRRVAGKPLNQIAMDKP